MVHAAAASDAQEAEHEPTEEEKAAAAAEAAEAERIWLEKKLLEEQEEADRKYEEGLTKREAAEKGIFEVGSRNYYPPSGSYRLATHCACGCMCGWGRAASVMVSVVRSAADVQYLPPPPPAAAAAAAGQRHCLPPALSVPLLCLLPLPLCAGRGEDY